MTKPPNLIPAVTTYIARTCKHKVTLGHVLLCFTCSKHTKTPLRTSDKDFYEIDGTLRQGRIPDISMYLFTEYTTIVDDSPIVQKAELRKLVYNSIWPALRQPYVSIGMDSKSRMTINFGELTFTNGVNKVEIIGASDGGRIVYTVYSNGDVLDLVIRGGTIKVYTVQNDSRQGARQRSAPTPSRKLIFEGDDVLLSRRNIYLPEY